MEELYNKTLFIFRRDLRLSDNTGLIHALEHSETVIPCFIFTPEQIDENAYRSNNCLQFMIESLEDLEKQLKAKQGKLYLFYDHPEKVVEQCIKKGHIDCVVANRDYTPFSLHRDKKIAAVCKQHGIPFILCDDALLHAPEQTLKADKTPYSIFTPYFRNASQLEVQKPKSLPAGHYFRGMIEFSKASSLYKQILPTRMLHPLIKGGRTAACKILENISRFSNYPRERDYPAQAATTHLSAYLKFTVVSPREVYHAIAKYLSPHHELIRALYWRDFFSSIAFFSPHVFKGAFHKKYNKLKWSEDKNAFKRWCEGTTGFPIVDAGMRELNETGFMHNRVRMIVASFLIKDMHINWQWGEKYFAQRLIDYDPAVNNGNWQWSASTGCDAQPYFRIFNPWNQQKRFDPDCEYIKRWVPELREIPPKTLHSWDKADVETLCPAYFPPMLEHEKESKNTLSRYRA